MEKRKDGGIKSAEGMEGWYHYNAEESGIIRKGWLILTLADKASSL